MIKMIKQRRELGGQQGARNAHRSADGVTDTGDRAERGAEGQRDGAGDRHKDKGLERREFGRKGRDESDSF